MISRSDSERRNGRPGHNPTPSGGVPAYSFEFPRCQVLATEQQKHRPPKARPPRQHPVDEMLLTWLLAAARRTLLFNEEEDPGSRLAHLELTTTDFLPERSLKESSSVMMAQHRFRLDGFGPDPGVNQDQPATRESLWTYISAAEAASQSPNITMRRSSGMCATKASTADLTSSCTDVNVRSQPELSPMPR